MSFPQATTTTPLSSVNNAADQSWVSDRFINLSVPDSDGRLVALITVKLKLSNPVHAQFIEFLDKDVAATTDPSKPVTVNLDRFMGAITANYQTKEKKERTFNFMES